MSNTWSCWRNCSTASGVPVGSRDHAASFASARERREAVFGSFSTRATHARNRPGSLFQRPAKEIACFVIKLSFANAKPFAHARRVRLCPCKTGECMARPNQARDDEQRAAIQAVLLELPENHPAREAYNAGADAIELTHLVDREDLAEKLNQAWLDWYARRLRLQRT